MAEKSKNKPNTKKNNTKKKTVPDKTDKSRNASKTKPIQWGDLAGSIVTSFIELTVLFIIGSRVVFAGKIAQFNVLPTDIECLPYRPTMDNEESPKFQSNHPEANIDRMYVASSESYLAYATKIMYEINDKSRKHYLLDKLRNIEYDPKVSTPIKYIAVCLTNLFVFCYGITNAIFGTRNKYLNESLTILIGLFVLSLFMLIVLPLSIITSLIICIVNFGWLFKENMNRDPDYAHKNKSIPVWRDLAIFGSVYNPFLMMLYTLFGLFAVFNLSFTPVPVFIALYCFLSPLFMSANIVSGNDDEGEKKSYGFLGSVQGLINTKLDMFMLLFSVFVVRSTFKYGNTPAGVMVLLAAAYFLYKQYTTPKKVPSIATGKLAREEQNMKYCPKIRLTRKEMMEIKRDEAEAAAALQEAYDESVVGKADSMFKDIVETPGETVETTAIETPGETVETAAVETPGEVASVPSQGTTPSPLITKETRDTPDSAVKKGGALRQKLANKMTRASRTLKRRTVL